ncbi:MAG: 30S ribosomal protein S14 [Candidatus Micrarchaeota archaeon]
MKHTDSKVYKFPKKGEAGRYCVFCGRNDGMVRKYGICMCRQCFKASAVEIGFNKYN